DGLPDCTQGDVNHDGCPGVCGVDDDGDGFADKDDPNVAALIERLCSNGIDEDNDGKVDDCGANAVGPGEDALAAYDDDEDGYIDDIHGFDFYHWSNTKNELQGSTHDSRVSINAGRHATAVAGIIAATIDNGVDVAGMHPRARLMLEAVSS